MMDLLGVLVAKTSLPTHLFGEIETFNNELYVVGDNYGTGFQRQENMIRIIIKIWEIVLENQDSFLYDIAYDSSNDLFYITGKGTGENLNPLGEAYTCSRKSR